MVDTNPTIDASLGLIYRLNLLWNKAEWTIEKGDYNKWDIILDSIYRNLLYEEDVVVEKDEETGKISKIKLKPEDIQIYGFLSKEISKAKKEFIKARTKKDKSRWRSIWYHRLQKKDIWLRKFMQQQKLYLRITERNPGGALFGTFGQKK